jgi:hypothetical protein
MTEMERGRAAAGAAVAAEKPFGPAAAAILAAGVASLTLGLLTSLAEAFTGVADALTFTDEVGPLSGKTIITICVLFVSWGLLAVVFRRSSPSLKVVLVAFGVMLALGVLGTFPSFFDNFAAE